MLWLLKEDIESNNKSYGIKKELKNYNIDLINENLNLKYQFNLLLQLDQDPIINSFILFFIAGIK